MTSPTSQAAKLYVVINQAPNGPHSPADVLRMLQEGAISRDTYICEDGGIAWVPVGQMEVSLWKLVQSRAPEPPAAPAPPPAPSPAPDLVSVQFQTPPSPFGPPESPVPGRLQPPAGYGGSSAPFKKADYPPEPVVVEVERDYTKPLRMATLLGALGLFFLPWLEFRCMNSKVMEQSGMQTITAKVTFSEELSSWSKGLRGAAAARGDLKAQLQFEMMPAPEQVEEKLGSEIGHAWLIGAAAFFIVIGIGVALGKTGRQNAGVAALLALVCLGSQMLSGFPLKTKGLEEMEKGMNKGSRTAQSDAAMQMMGLSKPGELLKVDYTPWFYAELGLLGLTAFIGFTGGGSRRKM